jgi:hypothetical protein
MKRSFWLRFLMLMATISLGGSLMQYGCANIATTVVKNVNPCGTIFSTTFCDPQAYTLMWVEPQDWERDPTCTVPTLCGVWPPVGGTSNTTNGTGT